MVLELQTFGLNDLDHVQAGHGRLVDVLVNRVENGAPLIHWIEPLATIVGLVGKGQENTVASLEIVNGLISPGLKFIDPNLNLLFGVCNIALTQLIILEKHLVGIKDQTHRVLSSFHFFMKGLKARPFRCSIRILDSRHDLRGVILNSTQRGLNSMDFVHQFIIHNHREHHNHQHLPRVKPEVHASPRPGIRWRVHAAIFLFLAERRRNNYPKYDH